MHLGRLPPFKIACPHLNLGVWACVSVCICVCVLCLNERLRLLSFHKFSCFCAAFSGVFPNHPLRMPLHFASRPAAAGTYNHFYFASLSATFLRRVSQVFCSQANNNFECLQNLNWICQQHKDALQTAGALSPLSLLFMCFPFFSTFRTPFSPICIRRLPSILRTTSASNSTSDTASCRAMPPAFEPAFGIPFA